MRSRTGQYCLGIEPSSMRSSEITSSYGNVYHPIIAPTGGIKVIRQEVANGSQIDCGIKLSSLTPQWAKLKFESVAKNLTLFDPVPSFKLLVQSVDLLQF